MNGARRAAVLLATLTDEDVEDILGRLPEDCRSQIEPCLDELRALGAAPGYDWHEVLDAESTADQGSDDHPAMETVAGADADLMSRLLAREPAPVVGALLAANDWPWRDAFLAGCSQGRRQALETCTGRAFSVAGAVQRTLIEALADRVHQAGGAGAAGESFDHVLDRHTTAATKGTSTRWRTVWAR